MTGAGSVAKVCMIMPETTAVPYDKTRTLGPDRTSHRAGPEEGETG